MQYWCSSVTHTQTHMTHAHVWIYLIIYGPKFRCSRCFRPFSRTPKWQTKKQNWTSSALRLSWQHFFATQLITTLISLSLQPWSHWHSHSWNRRLYSFIYSIRISDQKSVYKQTADVRIFIPRTTAAMIIPVSNLTHPSLSSGGRDLEGVLCASETPKCGGFLSACRISLTGFFLSTDGYLGAVVVAFFILAFYALALWDRWMSLKMREQEKSRR